MVRFRTPWTTHKPGVEWKQGVTQATSAQRLWWKCFQRFWFLSSTVDDFSMVPPDACWLLWLDTRSVPISNHWGFLSHSKNITLKKNLYSYTLFFLDFKNYNPHWECTGYKCLRRSKRPWEIRLRISIRIWSNWNYNLSFICKPWWTCIILE